ncbi:MAG: hypothetical protein J5819_07600 [Eubacterium sp.]|nr:hypothetical protein [Eubacterium sp.]
MYFSSKKHFLTDALLIVTGVNTLGYIAMVIVRMILKVKKKGMPDMLNNTIWTIQLIVSLVTVALICFVFIYKAKKFSHYMSLFEKDDMDDMGKLQEQYMTESKLSTLQASDITKLIQLWLVIFTFVQIINEFCSILYRRFAKSLFDLYQSGHVEVKQDLVSIYNQTHGFKYLAMTCAILIGVVVTAIFLSDKYLRLVFFIVAAVYFFSFAFLDMVKIPLFGRTIGIVWTSMTFHAIETVGMVIFAIYLRKRYRGL